MPLSRRTFLTAAGAVLLGGGVLGAQWFNLGASNGDGALSPQEAMMQALSGEIVLIDIRRPDEWSRTGVGQGAIPIDMRRRDFVEALQGHVADASTPVALICARGVRSRKLGIRLAEAGFSNILDVPEGMLGSGAGPGWIKRGLPVVPG